ncbi:hypothetical protein [Pseudoalteromonas luteoviolacea]|uniref:Excisionase n=1 Tax=Pseudoalteromonas luteoviolacea NCIMB 1942 TaxID=1365253 RepID=A0A162A9V0_9GAMM|nr:hypothetical protein [Pseudoalteromonas luteoviolacea]KZN46018.1 hypothetical protein N482_13165 [Pseudoalteromonas luteoviolacea NCIMB 1942]
MNAYIKLGWVLPIIMEQLKGLDKDKLDNRRKKGQLEEGVLWKKAGDNRIYYHFENWDNFVENGQ